MGKRLGAGAPAGIGAAGGPGPSTRPVSYAPVFFPGTSDAAGAATIRVASGEERGGIDMSLRIVALARLSGTVVDGNGQPVTAVQVWLVPKRGDQPSPADALVGSGAVALPRAVVSASGFVFAGVAPGRYTLVARTGSGQRGVAMAEAATATLWSVTDLTVDGADRQGLALRVLPGLTVTGRYVFEPGATAPPAIASMNLSFVATSPIPNVAPIYRAAVQPDGTFRVPSLAPGPYLVRVDVASASTGARWMLKSAVTPAQSGGRDLADRPLVAVADGSELSGVVVTFTDRAAEISGRLDRRVQQAGHPLLDRGALAGSRALAAGDAPHPCGAAGDGWLLRDRRPARGRLRHRGGRKCRGRRPVRSRVPVAGPRVGVQGDARPGREEAAGSAGRRREAMRICGPCAHS